MITNNIKEGGNVVPLFISFETLQRQQNEAYQQLATEWNSTCERYDAVHAVIKNDDGELAKLAPGDADLAKRFVAEQGEAAESQINRETISTLLAISKRYEAEIYGIGENAKRSRRFAASVSRQYRGPASDITSLESKRR